MVAWAAASLGEERPFAARLFRQVHGRGARSFDGMTDLSARRRARLAEVARLGGLALDGALSDPDGTRKLLLRTGDGHLVESVLLDLMPDDPATAGPKPGETAPAWSLCVSSQVGCNLGCRFCLTGTRKRARNLTTGEILGQVVHAARALTGDARARSDEAGKAVGNLVFMGMGEPLDNYDNVVRALRILQHPLGMDFSSRRVTVSTAGVVPGILRLAREPGLTVNLAVSLNATTDETRARLMPVGRAWPLEELLTALRAFPVPSRRRLTVEYVLLAGVNDTAEDARRLAALLRDLRCKVNLLSFNPWEGAPFARPSDDAVAAFRSVLRAEGLTTTVRASRGRAVGAACGQLGGTDGDATRG